MRTARPLIQNWSTFTLGDGSYLDFNSVIYLLSALMGVPTTTVPSGGTVTHDHTYTYSSDGLNTRPTFTIAQGYRNGTAEEAIRTVFQSFGFTFSRTASPGISGSGYARDLDFAATLGVNESFTLAPTPPGSITAGTFVVTGAAGTVNVVFNATNGSLLTAVNTALGAGGTANLTLTGGTLPAQSATITVSGGTLANTDVAALSINSAGLTGGSVVYTVLQAGGITTIPVEAVEAPQWTMYMDNLTSGGTIGTTKVRPYTGEFAFDGLVNPDWVIDAATESYDDDVLQVPDLSLNVVMRNDATARQVYADLMEGDTYLVRYEAVGPLTGEGTLRYLLRVDCAVQASENVGQFGDEGGSETMPFPLTIISDSTVFSGGFSAVLRNILTSM
jgi:hypothetical protein